jgi:hypothetical protein
MNTRTIAWISLVGLGILAGGCDGGPPEPPLGPFCGGIAGFPCPGAGDCVDDPRDDCDPENGGADCSGVCECNAIGLCIEGQEWDSSPDVCGCVDPKPNPCAAVLCPVGSTCEVVGDSGVCVPSGGEPCGKTSCAPGFVCCNSSCGICTRPGQFCIQIACE